MPKTIYCYNAAGVFTSTAQADESPLEPGAWLIPANATTIAPPVIPLGHHAVFADGAWSLVSDPVEPPPRPAPPTDVPAGYHTLWDGEQWVVEILPPPASVTMRQARLALLGAGLLDQINAAIAKLPGADGEAARIEWEYATSVDRGNPLIAAMANIAGLNEAALDGFFRTAAAL